MRRKLIAALSLGLWLAVVPLATAETRSVARQWNEELLHAIRNDLARPTVHARNLFHVSVAMWNAWAAYDPRALGVRSRELASAPDIARAREESISFAAYRILLARFPESPGADETLASIDALMTTLGYDQDDVSTVGRSPSALGNRIAEKILALGLLDGANEVGAYGNLFYETVNAPLLPDFPGNPDLTDANRWQPLALKFFIDQAGNVVPRGSLDFLSPEWGIVTPFSLSVDDLTIRSRAGNDYWLFHDPGPPPYLGAEGDAAYKAGFVQVVEFSSYLSPDDGVMVDISPASLGDNTLGTNDGDGHDVNPFTGEPYLPHMVPRGDYTRVLAEFWADGPDSETPPGHWFVILNYVSDHAETVKRIGGMGPVLDDLEWDVKAYLALGGAMHDAAIAAWGVKGWYDYIRPISAIRYMADLGQSTDSAASSFDPSGIPLVPDLIELVTPESSQPGARHSHLASEVGKIAILAWNGHVEFTESEYAGVGWILAENWWPYQRLTFVTPPFAGYVSGHSTYSRAAAELLTRFTGSEFFPGGIGEFYAPRNEFLVFEDGPSVDITLQWAKYYDASDECSLSYLRRHPSHCRRYSGAVHGLCDRPRRLRQGHGALRRNGKTCSAGASRATQSPMASLSPGLSGTEPDLCGYEAKLKPPSTGITAPVVQRL